MNAKGGKSAASINTRRIRQRSFRSKVLVGAIVAALALGSAGSAMAQTANHTLDSTTVPSWTQTLSLLNYLHAVTNTQSQTGDVSATLDPLLLPPNNNNLFIDYTGSGQAQTLTHNTVSTYAAGNNATGAALAGNPNDAAGNSIDLALLGADTSAPPANSGLGILSGQLNDLDNTHAVTSDASNATMYIDLTGYAAGTVTASDNTIRADAVLNDASSTISGNLPAATFAGVKDGSASIDYVTAPATPTLANVGDISVGNVQVNVDTKGSQANADNVAISITDDVSTAGDFTNKANTIAASYVGNDGTNTVSATGSDGGPIYSGSVVVSNGQANLNAPTAVALTNDTITTDITGSLITNVNGSGSITQSSDTISATAQGNKAGNAISFADGLNIDGTSVVSASTLSLAFASGEVHADNSGDLVLLNAQGNQQSDLASSITNNNAGIIAQALALAGAGTSVTLHDDHVLAGTVGNAATNGIRASGASFEGLVSAGSQQVNDASSVTASTANVRMRSRMTGGNNNGVVTVDENSIIASAQGNQATTDVAVAGTHFASGVGIASAGTSVPSGNNIAGGATNAGVSIGNVQADYGATDTIRATHSNNYLGSLFSGLVTGGSSTVAHNQVLAKAGANQASTSASLAGDNGVFTAALFNSQYLNLDSVIGRVDDLFLVNTMAVGAINGAFVEDSNSVLASANGNQADNSLSTDFTNATLGDALVPAWSAHSASLTPNGATTANGAHAVLALASSQVSQDTAFTAAIYDTWVAAYAPGDATNTSMAISGNSTSASAIANGVTNALDPGVGNLLAAGDSAQQIASLSNFQYADHNAVDASVDFAITGEDGFSGALSGSAVTVTSNAIAAFAAGAMADNAMHVHGTHYVPGAAVVGTLGDGLASVAPAAVSADAAWTLLNAQGGSGGSRQATITNSYLIAENGGALTNSPLSLANNKVNAEARDNYASNALTLDGFGNLASTAALLNTQGGDPVGDVTAVESFNTATQVAAANFGGNASGSDITVSDNGVTAKALANTALNDLGVTAGNLSGVSALVPPLPTPPADRGGVFDGARYLTGADYGLTSLQSRNGEVSAAVTNAAVFAGSDSAINGGSLTVQGNTQMALAESNSATNGLRLDVTRSDASAALQNVQRVATTSDVQASVTTAGAFQASAGGALGTTTVVPATVSNNTLLAQAGLNSAGNAVIVSAASAIAGTGVATVGVSTDITTYGFTGAIGDFSLYNEQTSSSGATATATPGLIDIEAANGGIGRANSPNGLAVANNHVRSHASANNAGNTVSLIGASSVSATTALNNTQTANTAVFNATTGGASVGIYDYTGAVINASKLTVSGNSLDAATAGNSASNAISVLPTALNLGFNQATEASVGATGSTAGASNALLNSQSNAATASATVQASNVGVNAGAPGASSQLLSSVATVNGNRASANASGNSAGNSILLASLPTSVASSALVSNQLNTAAIGATANAVQIGVNAGAGSTSPVTVSGNTISAIGVGNSAMNHIGIGN